MMTPARHSPELEQLCKLIEPMPVAMLTSLGHDGELVSRPMPALAMDDEGALWLYTDLSTARANPVNCVNLSFGDRETASYVSLSGEGRIETDRACIEALWSPFAEPWFPEGPESPEIALLKFIPHTADYWDAPHSRMVRMFTMRSSAIGGQLVGRVDHDRHEARSETARHAA